MKIDKRFYGEVKSYKLSDLSKNIKSTFPDFFHSCNFLKDHTVNNCSSIQDAQNKDIVFLENKKYFKYLNITNGVCLIIEPEVLHQLSNKDYYIATKQPRRVFAHILNLISPGKVDKKINSEISKSAILKKGVVIGKNVEIENNVVIGENSVIGDGVIISEGTEVGSNCTIQYSVIGKNCIIYPGARIGMTGFGFNYDKNGVYKFPHRGRVIIKNNVEIGANSTIDRGSLGDTIINDFVMVDNLVHIAHNVKIGKGSIICGQSGIAGSTNIGDNVVIAAQVGISGHLNIKSNTILSARSGVTKDIKNAELMGGFPAIPIKEFRKQQATLRIMTKKLKK